MATFGNLLHMPWPICLLGWTQVIQDQLGINVSITIHEHFIPYKIFSLCTLHSDSDIVFFTLECVLIFSGKGIY